MRTVSLVLMLVMTLQLVAPAASAVTLTAASGPAENLRTLTVPITSAGQPDQVIVRYKTPDAAGASQDEADLAKGMAMASLSDAAGTDAGVELIDIEPSQNLAAALAALRADPNVEYAEPNYSMFAQADPSDTRFPEQWALGEIDAVYGWEAAQSILTGLGKQATPTIVAVVDTGVDHNHEDLLSRLAMDGSTEIAYNAITATVGHATAADNSVNGHGTHVAGVIAAQTNNGKGIAGVAGTLPVSIMPVKALDSGGVGTMYDVSMGIRWAADNGAKVINLSLGARLPDFPVTLADAVRYAQDKGALVVAAAGNDNGSIIPGEFYPAALPGVMSVSATGVDHRVASFSNPGTIKAPGVDILSTDRNGGYSPLTGTSIAAPQAAGVAAAVFSVYPDRSATDIAAMIADGLQGFNWAGSYYADNVLNLEGALYGHTTPTYDLEMLAPAWDAFVQGDKVNVAVRYDYPDLVTQVNFYVDEEPDPDYGTEGNLIGTVYGPAAGTPLESGVFGITWDSTKISDGEHYLYAQVFDEPYDPQNPPSPLCSTSQSVKVLNNASAGLVLQVKKPPVGNKPGEAAAQAPVVVCHVSTDESGASMLQEVWRGIADNTGTVIVPSSDATAGNDFLVIASGSEPGFLYSRTVRAPGAYTIDSTGTIEVTVTAARQDDSAIAGATVLVEPLGANVPGSGDPDKPLSLPERYNDSSPFSVGVLNGAGTATIAVTPGSYAFRVEDTRQLVFLRSAATSVPTGTPVSVALGGADGACALQLDPDGTFTGLYVRERTIGLTDQSGRWIEFANVGSDVITLSPGDYDTDLEVTFGESKVATSGLEYRLEYSIQDVAETKKLNASVGTQTLKFGGPTRIDVAPTPTWPVEGNPFPSGMPVRFLTSASDSNGNAIDTYEYYNVSKRTLTNPIAVTIDVNRFSDGTHIWLSGNTKGIADYEQVWSMDADQDQVMYEAIATLAGNPPNPLGLLTSPKATFTIGAPLDIPPSYAPVQIRLFDRTGTPMTNVSAWLIERDGTAYRQVAEFSFSDGMISCYDSPDPEGSYGILICGETRVPSSGTPELLMLYVPVPAHTDLSDWSIFATDWTNWKDLDLSLENPNETTVTDRVDYSAYMQLGDRLLGGRLGSRSGATRLWVLDDAQLTVRAEYNCGTPASALAGDYSWQGILAAQSIDSTAEDSVVLGGESLVPVDISLPGRSEVESWNPKGYVLFQGDMPASPLIYGEVWVTPGDYRLQALVEREHFTGTWYYWFHREFATAADGFTVDVGGSLAAGISLDEPPTIYSEGSIVNTTHTITYVDAQDSTKSGAAVMGIISGPLENWPFDDPTAQTHMQIAPYLVIRNSLGREVYRYKTYGPDWDIIGDWHRVLYHSSWDPVQLAQLGDSTYAGGSWTIPKDLPGGVYTATIELGAGPDGTISPQEGVSFTVSSNRPGAPQLDTPRSPTKDTAITIIGEGAMPGSQVTVRCSLNGDPVNDRSWYGTADAQGRFSIQVSSEASPLVDGEYSFTADVTVGGVTGDKSESVALVVDRTAPGAPVNLTGEALDGPQVRLAWDLPDAGDGVLYYLILRNGNDLGVSISPEPAPSAESIEFTDNANSGLQPDTPYTYEVVAVDLAGNQSAASAVTVRTVAGVDKEPPSIPQDVAVVCAPGGLATVTWGASTDRVAVAKYLIYRFAGDIPLGGLDGVKPIGELSVASGNPALAYDDSNLAASTRYTYCVTAVDVAGNESQPGSAADTTPVLSITQFTVSSPRNQRGVLQPGGTFRFIVAGEPRRQAQVNLKFDSWIGDSGSQLPTPVSKTIMADLEEQLDNKNQPTGIYIGGLTLPAGAAQVNSLAAIITDGVATEPATRELKDLSLTVAGSLRVTVSAADSDLQLLAGGTLTAWDDDDRTGGTVTMVGTSEACVLSGLRADTDYSLAVRAQTGQLLKTELAVSVRPGIDTNITVTPPLPASLAVIVVDDDHTDTRVAGVGVVAFDDDRQTQGYGVSNGSGGGVSIVPFALSGTRVTLSASIPDTLLGLYQPAQQVVTLTPGANTTTIHLQPLPTATIEGTVSDQYSKPLAGAEIRATLQIGTKTLNLSTVTDSAGKYSLTVPIGDWVRLSFSHRIAQQTAVTLDPRLSGGETRTVDQSLTTAAVIAANLFVRRAGDTTESPIERLTGYLPQLSLKAEIGEVKETVDCSTLPFLRVFQADANDVISLTLDGSSAGLTTQTQQVTLNELRNGATEFHLVENGKIKARVSDGSGQSYAGLPRTALVFAGNTPAADASPSRVYTSNYPDFTSQALPAGDYTVVFYWGNSAAWYSGATLWAPAATYGFWSGPGALPHTIRQATVATGELTNLADVVVNRPSGSEPVLFDHDGNGFTASVAEAAPGSLVTLRLAYACDKTCGRMPYGLNIWADVPAGTTLVDGSVAVRTLAGNEPTVTTGGRIKLTFGNPFSDNPTQSLAGVLTYQVRVPTAPTWPTVQARAYAEYQATLPPLGIISCWEDLGAADVRVPVLSITVPPTTTSNLVNLSGKAPPGATVDVYDGTMYIGETVAHAYGTWKMSQVMLPDRGTPGAHYLVAQVKQGDVTLTTKATKVVVGSLDPSLESLMMCQIYGEYQLNKVTYYPATGASSFPFWLKPGAQPYYEVKFSDNSRVENVRILVGKSGQYVTVPMSYNSTAGAFVASTASVLMGDIYVRYDVKPELYKKHPLPAESILRSAMPDAWRDAIITTPIGGQAIGAQADGDIGGSAQARVTLGNGKVMDFTITTTASSYVPTSEELAAVAAGGPPAFNHQVSVTDVYKDGVARAKIEASWVMPLSEATGAPGAQSLAAASAEKVAIKVIGESPIEGGLGVSDLYDTIKSGFEFKEKMDKLNELFDKVVSNCDSSSVAPYKVQLDYMAKKLLANLCVKYGLQLVGIGLGATGVGLIGTVALWAVSGVVTEIADAKWDTNFDKLEKEVAADEDCKKKDDDNDNDDDSDDPDPDEPPTVSPRYLIDPSGYVYEGVPDNRLPGVTAWAYEVVDGVPTVWDSSWAEQFNPLTTDDLGKYGWDVPEGDWKVVWARAGYEGAESELIHVPPPRTDVNVGMVSLAAPTVTSVLLGSDGTFADVTFSKYMQVDTVSVATFTVTPSDATLAEAGPLSGSVAPVSQSQDPANPGKQLAQVFRFTPAVALTRDTTYTVLVSGAVQSYAGIPLGSDYTAVKAVPDPEQPSIGEVTGATVSAGQQSLTVRWTDPASEQLTSINVCYRIAGGNYGSAVAVAKGTQSRTLSGLQGGATYQIKIPTVDALGRESVGVVVTGVPTSPSNPPDTGHEDPGTPSQPGGGSQSGGDTVRFIAVVGGGAFSGWDGEITLDVTAGTFGASTEVTVRRAGDPTAAAGMVPASPVYEILASGGQPGKPVLLTIKYDPSALGGLDPTQIGIYQQDDTDPTKWVFVGGVVDPIAGTVSVWLPHFSRYAVFARRVTFLDLSGHWARTDIETLASRGIVGGSGDGRFNPEAKITRAELAKLLVTMVALDPTRGIEPISPTVATFRDVPSSAWYYQYVEAAAKAGLVTGDAGLFRPGDPVTREEMAVMVIRAMQLQDKAALLKDKTPAFEDGTDIAAWSRGYVGMAVFKGLMRGITDTTFGPKGLSTRAQAAVVVKRAMERLGLLEKTVVVKGTVHLSLVEGKHLEMKVTAGGTTVTYVLEPDGGPEGVIAQKLDGIIGTEIRVLAIRRAGASIYMAGPVLRVLEVWRPGCPLCPPES